MYTNITILFSLFTVVSSFTLESLFCFSSKFQNPCSRYGGELLTMCNDYINSQITGPCTNFKTNVDKFVSFIFIHGKTYHTVEQVTRKYVTFEDNLKFISDENSKNHSYILGVNIFADYTLEEYREMLTVLPTLPKDYCIDSKSSTNTFPTSVDWVSKGKVTRVKDQGQCGSCWAFSTIGAVESLHAINTGLLTEYSEQQLVDCASSYGNHGCNGGLMTRAFSYIIDNGIVEEDTYPYTATVSTCTAKTGNKLVKSCYNVPANEYDLTLSLSKQPISVSIEADSRSFQLYKSGVYDNTDCGTTLDHGVLAVGYGTMDGKDYYRVKNSWSEQWGDNGYIYMIRNSNKNSVKGQCGIAMDASYPQ